MGSNIVSSSLSLGVGAGVQNVQFVPSADDVKRKAVIIGTYLATVTDLPAETLLYTPSAAYTGSRAGYGSMLHRLHLGFELGSGGQVETWLCPQAESGSPAAVVATGEVDFAGTTGVKAGTLALYFGNFRIAVGITDAMTIENIVDAIVAAVALKPECPVSVAKHAVTFELDVTAKSKGPWGNDISISLNNQFGDVTPTGITAAITTMASGANLPDIQDALDALGLADAANEKQFTALVHGYGQDTTTLDAISNYNGAGNELVGCYSEIVARPFRSLVGNVASDLSTISAVGTARKNDRTNGIVAAPTSLSNPHELAAQVVGYAERQAAETAGLGYGGHVLIGANSGTNTAARWTNNYSTGSDTSIAYGIGNTKPDGYDLKTNDTVTFYHPDSISVSSNGWREFCHIPKLQNILNSLKVTFSSVRFQNAIIVDDVSKVGDSTTRRYTIDTDAVRAAAVQLINAWERKAWIFQAKYTIQNLVVELRTGNDGFNLTIPVVLSGTQKIFDHTVQFDISPAAILLAA